MQYLAIVLSITNILIFISYFFKKPKETRHVHIINVIGKNAEGEIIRVYENEKTAKELLNTL